MQLPSELSLFWDIGLIIASATVVAYVARLLRQPLILAYLIAGFLIGPGGFALITNQDVIRTLSEFGIAFLLFIVGLELDLRKLKNVGLSAVTIAVLNSTVMFALGFVMARAFGFTGYAPVYLGLTLAFSSTMIVVKLLSKKNELSTLHGRIIVAILLTEDVIAIMALSILSTPGDFSISTLSESFGKGVILLLATLMTGRLILPTVLRFVSRSQELLFLTALSICFILAGIAQIFGFSIAIGSFLAGLSIASFPYNIEIISRVQSLRDFFSTIFFVSLGMGMGISFTAGVVLPFVIALAMVIIGKTVFLMLLCSRFGYSVRTSFLTATSLSQISEFSLILAIQGIRIGHTGQDVFSITVLLMLVTAAITSYLNKFEGLLYRGLSRYLSPLERLSGFRRRFIYEAQPSHLEGRKRHVVVCGYHRMGYGVVKALQRMEKELLVIEFDPDIIDGLNKEGIPSMYGDIGDIEVLRRANLSDTEIVISTVPLLEDNLLLIDQAKKINPRIVVIVTASSLDHALELYASGADYVVLPKWLAGEKAAELIGYYVNNPHGMENLRHEHVRHIERIKSEEFFERYTPGIIGKIGRHLKRLSEAE
ncbi:MAG: cation:proton antiporter [Candidatus Altiarchaeota archaeon]|nr:cation:proton antiporter [Candidatus Altiarchaeota archaeon]